MVIYMDTSSLIKRYVEEQGSCDVDKYFNSEINIWISPITIFEINSALKRKVEDASINNDTYLKAVDFFVQDYKHYSIVSFDVELIGKVLEVIKSSRSVKTLDAIQIGSALLSGAEKCITSDTKMHQVMQMFAKDKAVFI